ncbi:MAG: glycosyltransferase family 87 protein [Candidatus Caldarchaeales archaeon]
MRLDAERLAQFTPLIVAMSWGLSVALHHPFAGWMVYSDVVSFWVREEHLADGRVPCIGYFFEYPPSACYITYAARLIGGRDLIGYYIAFSLLSLPAFMAIGYVLTRLSRGSNPYAFVFAFSPSLIVYGIYNYDHFLAALLGLSVLAMNSGRPRLAGLLLGLSVSVKLMTVLLLPLYLLERKGNRLEVLAWFAAGAGVPSLPVLLLNPGWFAEFVRFHATWVLENAWYVWIFQDPFSPTAKLFGLVLLVPLLLRSYTAPLPFGTKSFLTMSSWLLTSYVFTPQMLLWLIPLAPFAAAALYFWPVMDVANTYIILTWFTTDSPTRPWTLPQAMALIRAAALALAFLFAQKSQERA